MPIVSWYDDPSDRLLFEYVPILIGLSVTQDVRTALCLFVDHTAEVEEYRVDVKRAISMLSSNAQLAMENLPGRV